MHNALQEPTIIHWHGLHAPAAMDGHPSSTIGPGGRFEYDFKVKDRGGTYWYHTHAYELTAEQAYGGLASFFLIDDEDQRRLSKALDLRLGETDLPILIQDKLPMHIHGFSFQVVERLNSPRQLSAGTRFGRGRLVSDLGWKDTVLVWPGETVKIALDFSHDFPGNQTYVFHCHTWSTEMPG